MLPNFIVIGVAKAGTTSLYRYLDQHPDVYICPEKGTNYFGYEDALNWTHSDEGEPPLLRHFHVQTFEAYLEAFAGANGESAIGEVSPQYFRCPAAAARIHAALPDVRLVASLRNPAERAFSGFLMRVRRGEPVGSAYDELAPGSSHVKEGYYYERMKRYYDLFPRERIKVFLFDDFKRSPAAVVRELYEFLGVDPEFVPDTGVRHNPASVPKSRWLNRLYYHPRTVRAAKVVLPAGAQRAALLVRQQNLKPPPTLPADLRAQLLDLYRDDVRRLEGLLERDLSVWFEPA